MKPSSRVVYLTIAILAISLLLAIVKPSLVLWTQRPYMGYGLHLDYGIPTGWYKGAFEQPPAGVTLPKDSIGLDFINIDSYLRCAGIDSDLYTEICPDPYPGRTFHYPPFFAVLFLWIFLFDTLTNVAVWSLFGILAIFGMAFYWFERSRKLFFVQAPGSGPLISLMCAVLFTFSYPAIFYYERVQSDALILIAATLCSVALLHRRWFWLGVSSAALFLLKVYPIFITAAVGLAALLRIHKEEGRNILIGQIVAAAVMVLPLASTYYHYFFVFLPEWGTLKEMPAVCNYCHSLPGTYGNGGAAVVLLAWALAAWAFIRCLWKSPEGSGGKEALLFFCYLLAISVYFAYTSYDYNLIMVLPLFAVTMGAILERRQLLLEIGYGVLLLGYALPRWLQEFILGRTLEHSFYFWLQIIGLGIILVALLQRTFFKRGRE